MHRSYRPNPQPRWPTAIRKHLSADIGLAATGVAGPDEQEGQAPGTVWLAIATRDGVHSAKVMLPGDANRIRQYAVISLMNLLRRHLLGIRSPAVL